MTSGSALDASLTRLTFDFVLFPIVEYSPPSIRDLRHPLSPSPVVSRLRFALDPSRPHGLTLYLLLLSLSRLVLPLTAYVIALSESSRSPVMAISFFLLNFLRCSPGINGT